MMTIGPVTFFPIDCAMHGAVQIKTRRGWLVLFPPIRSYGHWWKSHGYWSPNATPWHHAMIPLWGCRKSTECVCGRVDCTAPKFSQEYYDEAYGQERER